ncbi:protein APCDD1-like [Danio aesculapii]|uniref:protein APCDD1-like n=1 Tax=Danio aesculapii TaxID=1142201 RepID=UPI0024C0D2F1|nr:protein APCDD1-like [Danio aesculapii]
MVCSVRSDSSACDSTLHMIHGDSQVTASIPPNITGHWVSSSCEVRPGPEFLTRSYRFFPNHTFTALQFYYQDSGCSRPFFSVCVEGRVRVLQASWRVPGAAAGEYQLTRVQLLCTDTHAAELLRPRLHAACGSTALRPGHLFLLWAADGPDCTRALHFSMQELLLMRLELRRRHGDQQEEEEEELFLGDVHTERAQRSLHQPAGYQSPLLRAKLDVQRCPLCPLLAAADLLHPPVLPAVPAHPLRLQGDWVSLRCEVRPGVLFLTRRLTFHPQRHTWDGRYTHYSDPACRHPTFSITASGEYTPGGASAVVPGAHKYTFTVLRMSVTAMDAATASLLSISRGRACGSQGSWRPGVPQDVTNTSGCPALGVRLPHTEYELLQAGLHPSGRPLLLNGQRPTGGSSPDRPHSRPTAFQPPLIHCGTTRSTGGGQMNTWRSGARRNTHTLTMMMMIVMKITL